MPHKLGINSPQTRKHIPRKAFFEHVLVPHPVRNWNMDMYARASKRQNSDGDSVVLARNFNDAMARNMPSLISISNHMQSRFVNYIFQIFQNLPSSIIQLLYIRLFIFQSIFAIPKLLKLQTFSIWLYPNSRYLHSLQLSAYNTY